MISKDKITEIFCAIDDFCKEMNQIINENSIQSDNSKKKRNRKCKMSDSEVITISYNRFVELQKEQFF